MQYRTRSGRTREVEAKYVIVDRAIGKPIQPRSKGYAGYAYPNRYAAEQAISAMPARWRGRYEARRADTNP